MSRTGATARRTLLALLALPALLTAGLLAAAGQGDALGSLMALLAQRRHASADFEQTQYLAVLKRPAHSSGVLSFDAPDHLEQRTLKPRPQSLVLDHGMLTLEAGTHRRTLRLEDYPQLAPLIESVRATLAGDRAALEQNFETRFEGDLGHWQLTLVPRAAAAAGLVERIRLSGEGAAIRQVEVQQRDGDHSLMSITPHE